MNRHFFAGTFLAGAIAVVWVATGFWGSNLLALSMTLIIGATYAFGTLELHRFRQATATLATALSAIPAHLDSLEGWLADVHPSLQNSVRARIEGARVGLPGPAFTPYLVGLLVMLGMLGTFLGMVVTLNGAVFALEGTTDLQAIRSAFAAPIKGLGLAFGTSVAGVASSAMLGLLSAMSRRERMLASQRLDSKTASVLRPFSLGHQRQEAYKALQLQTQALPAVVEQMQTMMERMQGMHQQLSDGLLRNQQDFHRDVKGVYTELASSVDQSLRASLTQGAHAAGESIKPVMAAAMADLSRQATLLHERVAATTELQLATVSARFSETASGVTGAWTQALDHQARANTALVSGLGATLAEWGQSIEQRTDGLMEKVAASLASLQVEQAAHDRRRLDTWMGQLEHILATMRHEWQQSGSHTLAQQQAICNTLSGTALEMSESARNSAGQTLEQVSRLMARMDALAQSRLDSDAAWDTQQGQRMDELVGTLRTELQALRDDEASRAHAAVERLGALQEALARHLSTLGTALEEPITRLIQTASEAPRAAAEVIGKLRQEISASVARDNELLEERARIMDTLNALLEAINHASVEQRAVIDALVASSAGALNTANSQFADKVDEQATKLSDIAASVTGSAVEVSALSETLAFAVSAFGDANAQLITSLQRIEGALDKSMVRSDEQLAYYVAQAREIIDLSIMSQKEIVGELGQLSGKQARIAAEVA